MWIKDTALIKKGIEFSLVQNYDSAIQTFNLYTKKYPNSPVGYYMLSILYATFMTDFEVFSKETQLYQNLNKGNKIVENSTEHDEWYYYFKGAFKVVESAYLTRKGKISSIYKGFGGIDDIKDGNKINNKNGDIQFYLGFYYYGKGVVAKKFSWLGFNGVENTDKALQSLKYASKNSIFVKEVSIQTIVNILGETKRFKEGEKIGLQFYKKYPTNRSIMWALAKLYKNWGKNDSSIIFYTKLWQQFDQCKNLYPYNYFSLNYQLGKLYKKKQNFEMAKKFFNLNINNSSLIEKFNDKRLKKFISKSENELQNIEEKK